MQIRMLTLIDLDRFAQIQVYVSVHILVRHIDALGFKRLPDFLSLLGRQRPFGFDLGAGFRQAVFQKSFDSGIQFRGQEAAGVGD